MTAIDYAKYEGMTKRELAKSLKKAEKKIDSFYLKIKQQNELVKYLNSKIKKPAKNDKYDFIPYEKSGLPELAKEIEKQFSPQELAQIRQEVQDEINRDYGDEL